MGEDKLKQMLNLLVRIFSNDVISMPFKTKNDKTYTIEYFRTYRSMEDSLSKSTRWRVTDHLNQITFAPSGITEMLAVIKRLNIDLDMVSKIVEHHLIMTIGWHNYCMARVIDIMGAGYIEECLIKKDKIVDEIANIVKEMADGKDVTEKLSKALLTGEILTANIPHLTLVERTKNE